MMPQDNIAEPQGRIADAAAARLPHAERASDCFESNGNGRDGCIRAEREDDDGYDPYSDRIEIEPLFERDPWS